MALFRCASGSSGGGATITVTYSSDFYGETVTCSHGTKTYSKVATSSGTLEFSVDEEGTWTISSMGFSDTADVVLNYPAELVSLPNGETVLPTDDIETWLACAAITDKAYTTLSQVLGDSETYNALLGDSNACAYMKRSTTWSTDICASQYAMNLLGQYDTACDALLSDSTWASAIANSTYAESVIRALVPKMTSNTAPSGVAFASSTLSGRDNYRAFDGNPSTDWSSSTATYPQSIGYQSPTPMCVKKISFTRRVIPEYTNNVVNVILQGSNDGQTWSDIGEAWNLRETDSTNSVEEKAFLNNSQYYSYHQLKYLSLVSGSNNINPTCVSMQFYGHAKSGVLIHGGNPTYDSFYRIVDGNHVPVTDPSLLDAGTYTIYSNGLAKDPSNLSNDYGKTVRICPNTKEIVVRPDSVLYWYGYNSNKLEWCTTANGWSGFGSASGGKEDTPATTYIPISRKGDGYLYNVGTKEPITGVANQTKQVTIAQYISGGESNCNPCGGKTTKILSGGTTNPPYTTLQTSSLEKSESVFTDTTSYLSYSGSSARTWAYNIYATWIE